MMMPMTTETIVETSPIRSDTRPPHTSPASMSLPVVSVPSGKRMSDMGGRKGRPPIAHGPRGNSSGAISEMTTMPRMTIRPTHTSVRVNMRRKMVVPFTT